MLTPPPATAASAKKSTTRDVTLGSLFFDPQRADFNSWMNVFKNEVYRNWVVPQKALLNAKGHVAFEFVVERDGSVSELRKLQSTVPAKLEEAARNALAKSQLATLPQEFSGERVAMQLTFFYREEVR